MAFRHKEFDIEAVQFHPESIMTPLGNQIFKNWLSAPLPGMDGRAGAE
jgi:anthranilate synthase component 2